MTRRIVNPGTLFWTGQHWINYLRRPGEAENSGMVSLWHTHYCAAGEGTAAYIDLPGLQSICTDNPDIVAFMNEWMAGRGGLYDMDLPIIEAQFRRSGDLRSDPSWTIQTATDRIEATWTEIQPPVILDAPAPKFRQDCDVYSYLFFAAAASISLNEQATPGQPYITDIWQPSIGGDRSSCVFALSETFISIPR